MFWRHNGFGDKTILPLLYCLEYLQDFNCIAKMDLITIILRYKSSFSFIFPPLAFYET